MLVTTNAIVLSKLRYKDYDLIVKCYSEDYGVISYLVKGVFKSRKGNSKIAYFQLLSQLQIVFNYNSSRTLHIIKEVKPNYLYNSLHTNILKSSVAIFISEVLSRVLKEEEQNQSLYTYLETTLMWFDTQTEFANFHLLFLLDLTKYLGFYPDKGELDYDFFNLKEGCFEDKNQGKLSVSGDNLILLKSLLGITFDTLYTIKINAFKRKSFLSIILLYFELHLSDFKTPKSLQVFNQVFN